MVNPSTNKIAVVVLNWNGSNDTISCITSLQTLTYDNFKIILIDNGSSDAERYVLDRFVEQSGSSITYIKNDSNLGFAGGVNTGIRYAIDSDFDAVALINNDATVDRAWLTSLESELSRQDAGIITGALLHSDGATIDSTGELYSVWGLPFPRGRSLSSDLLPEEGYIFGATGGSTLYRKDVFEKVGLFDEHFFAYYEDVDISFRSQLMGQRVYYTPKAIAYHKQGASSNKIPGFGVYQTFKNLPLVYSKNVPKELRRVIGPRFYFAYAMMLANAVTRGDALPALKGFFKSLYYFPYARKEHRNIMNRKTVSAAYINEILWHDLPPNQTGLRKLRAFFTHNP